MSNIEHIFGKKTLEQWREFAESQFQVITNLNKELEKIKAEKKHAEYLLTQAAPTAVKSEQDTVSPEEQICRDQLRILNSSSKDRELTAEECRKVDIYTKLLIQLSNSSGKKKISEIDGLKTEDLLKLVETDSDVKSKNS